MIVTVGISSFKHKVMSFLSNTYTQFYNQYTKFDILELWIFYIIHYFFYIIDIYIAITAEHPSHGVKGAFWMFPSPYNINLLIIYLFNYSYGVNFNK